MIKLIINGREYTQFQSAILTAGFNELARSFTIDTFEELASDIEIQNKIEIYIDNDKFLTGFIEGYATNISNNQSRLTFEGRSNTGDLVDCSPEIDGDFLKNKNYKEVIESIISKFGIKLKISADVKNIKYTAINKGEKCIDYLVRITAKYGYALTTNADGDLVVESESAGDLIGDLNWLNDRILSVTRSSNYSNRFSKYTCVSQDGKKSQKGVYIDNGVNRYRPKVFTEEGVGVSPTERARNEALKSTGQAIKVAVKYKGHRLPSGELFEIGKELYFDYPKLRIQQKLLIETLSFSQNEKEGMTADINLVDPRAYYTKKPRVNGSDKELKDLISAE